MLLLFQTVTTMSLTTLKDDLLAEFREERIMINDQLEILDPLGTSLRMPAAQKLYSSSTLYIAEYGCYVFCAAAVGFTAAMPHVYPFSLMNTVAPISDVGSAFGLHHVSLLSASVYTIVGLLVISMLIVARLVRSVRLKNEILRHAGHDVKIIVSQHLLRRAAMEAIEQRHLLATTGIVKIPSSQGRPVGTHLATTADSNDMHHTRQQIIPA
jgi:hypothetical protein